MTRHDTDRMNDFFETVSYAGEVQPWRDIEALATSEDEPDDPVLVPSKATSDHRARLLAFQLEWDEADHPRDEGGKFATAGTKGIEFTKSTTPGFDRQGTKKDGGVVLARNTAGVTPEMQQRVFKDLDPLVLAGQMMEDLPGDFRLTLMDVTDDAEHPGSQSIAFRSRNMDLGISFHRTFTRHADGTLTVHHDLFSMPDELQGKGLAKAVLADGLHVYRQLGVDRIDVTANLDRGAYAWAKFGFQVTNPRYLADSLTSKMERSHGWLGLTDQEHNDLVTLIDQHKDDPKLVWHLAGVKVASGKPVAKKLLYNEGYDAVLDLHDKESMTRLEHYIEGH